MKLTVLNVNGERHLAVETERGFVDAHETGLSLEALVAGADRAPLEAFLNHESLSTVEQPCYAKLFEPAGKLVCVGLNYRSHALKAGFELPETPTIFSKFANALAAGDEPVILPPWEKSYDYEAELVIVMGKKARNVSEEEALESVFGYTCGNDLSCRDSQKRSGQWLIGKTMPGFGPCGPCIVTADAFDPDADNAVRSFVNGELRQDGLTSDMIFTVAQVIAYASRYVKLEPGDLIFTGTPSGVALEGGQKYSWLKAGDLVEIEIEGIGRLRNLMIADEA